MIYKEVHSLVLLTAPSHPTSMNGPALSRTLALPAIIRDCYVTQTLGLALAGPWYATVLRPSMEEGDNLYDCLERWGIYNRHLLVRIHVSRSKDNLERIRQTNIVSNMNLDALPVCAKTDETRALLDFVPEHLAVRQVVSLQWLESSPYTFPFTPEHPPLFFCHNLGPRCGVQLGIKLQDVLIRDDKEFTAPHEYTMKKILANGSGYRLPPNAMRKDFELALWVRVITCNGSCET